MATISLPLPTPTTRDAQGVLAGFLSRVQGRGDLDDAQAKALQSTWQPSALPVPEQKAIRQLDSDTLNQAALELLALAHGQEKAEDRSFQEAMQIIAAWKLRLLLNLHEEAQDEYERRVIGFLPFWTLNGWHKAMIGTVLVHLAQQAILGSGGRLTTDDLDRLNRTAERETRYLLRFADDVAVAIAKAKPLSDKQIAHRAQMYAGTARASFYQALERRPHLWPNQGPDKDIIIGWVVEYVSLEDDHTCYPCFRANGYYLPGEGPYPGTVCLGRSQCRCRRVLRWLPDVWRKLAITDPSKVAGAT